MSSDDEFVLVSSDTEDTVTPMTSVVPSDENVKEEKNDVAEEEKKDVAEEHTKDISDSLRTYKEFVNDLTPVKPFMINGVYYFLQNMVPVDNIKSMMRDHSQCVECVSRASKFSRLVGPLPSGRHIEGSVFLRNIHSEKDGGCPDGCLFKIRKEIEKMNNKENFTTATPFLVKENSFPPIAHGKREDGTNYEHPTIVVTDSTPNDKVLIYEGLIKRYFSIMSSRLEKLCEPESITGVRLIMDRINELERSDHWKPVLKWVKYVQDHASKFKRQFKYMTRINKVHVIMAAITSGRNEVNNESGSYVHLDYQQSSNIVDFLYMESTTAVLKEMDRRSSPETYQVRRVAEILAEKNVTSDMTITLTWEDSDDLDLHVLPMHPALPEIYFGRRNVRAPNGSEYTLDFDANASSVIKKPCENTSVGPGTFQIMVNNYRRRVTPWRPIPFTIVIREKGKPDIEINEVWPTDRNPMNKMTITTHTFGEHNTRPLEMTTKESNRAKALNSKWIENMGEPTATVPCFHMNLTWCPYHTWSKKKDLSPHAPVFTPSSNVSFMELANNPKPKKKSLAASEAERNPTTLTHLLGWLNQGSHRVTVNPRELIPGYITRIETAKNVFKERYIQHHYTNKFMLPIDPMTCNEASNARFNENWFKSGYIPQSVEVELFCDIGITNNHWTKKSWFMVLKDVTLPIYDSDYPIASGFRPTNLKAEFHDLRDRWVFNNTEIKPIIEEGGIPAIGSFITTDTINIVVDGKNICVKVD